MSWRRGGADDGDTTPLPVKNQPPPYGYEGDPEKQKYVPYVEEEYTPCLIRYITAISRTTGVILVCAMWLLTGLLMKDLSKHKYAPWYIMSISILTTFFELIWMINKCVVSCIKHKCACHECRQDGCCCTFWRFLVWIDNWRKTILYILFSIPCFLQDIFTAETCIVGLLLIATAAAYFTKSFKESSCVKGKRLKEAYVQTPTPQTSIVQHPVQVGRDSPPPGYSTTHTKPNTVQPAERDTVTSRRPRTGSVRSSDGEQRSDKFLDPSGKKRQRYEKSDSQEGYASRPESPRYERSRDKDREEFERDRYERARDERDRRDEGYDKGPRGRDYDNDRYREGDRDYGRERKRNYDTERDRDYRERYDRERDRDYERDRCRERDYERDRDHRDGPEKANRSSREVEDSPRSKRKPTGTETGPVAPKPSKSREPPPLKELPPQASEALKKSAAANLVKQVSAGSPVLLTTGSAPTGMPSKIEQKAANMSNPFDQEPKKTTNPFEEEDEDEYFD